MKVAETVGCIVPAVPRPVRARWRAPAVAVVLGWCALWGPAAARADVAAPAPALDAAQAALVTRAWDGFRRGQGAAAQDAAPALRGSLVEPWLRYWALQPDLRSMTQADYAAYAAAYPDTESLELLRRQWLFELGRRQDWVHFAQTGIAPQDADDVQLQCLTLQAGFETTGEDVASRVLDLWSGPQGSGVGCDAAARALAEAGRIDQQQLWSRLRGFFAQRQFAAALSFAQYLPVGAWKALRDASEHPLPLVLSLRRDGLAASGMTRQVQELALMRYAQQDPAQAMRVLEDLRGLTASTRGAVALVAARAAAEQLLPDAASMFNRAAAWAPQLRADPETTRWMLRAGLRQADWPLVQRACAQLLALDASDRSAAYWSAVAMRELGHGDEARAAFEALASPWSYYGQLATEALGRSISLPAQAPAPAPVEQVRAQAARGGVQRALQLYALGIFAPAAQEWRHALRGLDDAQLHAAAQAACDAQAWMLCINASDTMKGETDWTQRFVMPYRGEIQAAAQQQGVSAAFVFGLIRQESRFAAQIQSWVGADGLMQLMPATSRWVAHKIGLAGFDPANVTEVRTNVTLGSAYLGMLLQRFRGSESMAAAAYNAGPGRPARWVGMPLPAGTGLSAAVFAENIPMTETRNYVKQVLANTTVYAALLSGNPQSLKSRLALAEPSLVAGTSQMP